MRIRVPSLDNMRSMYHLVLLFQEVTLALNISIHFTGGSLLGVVRHAGIIPWEHDADVCVSNYESEKALWHGLCNNMVGSRIPFSVELSGLFDRAADRLRTKGVFAVSDIVSANMAIRN